MKKRAIVADSMRATPRGSHAAPLTSSPRAPHRPGPLEGATFIAGAAGSAQLPAAGLREIGFAGRSNAGKSSAINALARRTRLAFASRTPGRTQQINFFDLRSGALVADLPGYGYAAVSRATKEAWQEFLWSYVTTRDTLIGLVLVVDARHGLRAADLDLLKAFVPSGRPLLVLATKADKLNQQARRAAVVAIRRALTDALPQAGHALRVIAFSATSREGVDAANDVLADWLGSADSEPSRRIEKGPAIKGSDAGPQNARAGVAGTGTRSGRKAGDVHRPHPVTAPHFRKFRNA
jgi:GTP-binding protein